MAGFSSRARIKDIIVTSTGEKIAPGDLETAILADPLFAQAMVIGENRPYLAVLAVLDPEVWDREKRGLATNRSMPTYCSSGSHRP